MGEFGVMGGGRKFFFLLLFFSFPFAFCNKTEGCQVEADRELFWDWLFSLPGSWHGAPSP